MDRVRDLGAEAVVLDASDLGALGPAVREAEPEIVINQLTELPEKIDLKKAAESLAVRCTVLRSTSTTRSSRRSCLTWASSRRAAKPLRVVVQR